MLKEREVLSVSLLPVDGRLEVGVILWLRKRSYIFFYASDSRKPLPPADVPLHGIREGMESDRTQLTPPTS